MINFSTRCLIFIIVCTLNFSCNIQEECKFQVKIFTIDIQTVLEPIAYTVNEDTPDSMKAMYGSLQKNEVKVSAEIQRGDTKDRVENSLRIFNIKSWELFDKNHSFPEGGMVYLRISDQEQYKDSIFSKLHVMPDDIEYQLVSGSTSGLYWEGDKIYEPTEKGYESIKNLIEKAIKKQFADQINLETLKTDENLKKDITSRLWWDGYGNLIFEIKTNTPGFFTLKGEMKEEFCK